MIDLHCHILPNLDDGAPTITESIKMAKLALKKELTLSLQLHIIKMVDILISH